VNTVSIEIMEDEIDVLLGVLYAPQHCQVAEEVADRIIAAAVEKVDGEE